jgi:DNA-binding transcriptional MerR regulator
MIISKEVDETDFVGVFRKLTEEDHAEFSKALAEYRALRDSLRAQGYSEEEVEARLKSRFDGETEGVEQITPMEYLSRMKSLLAKGYSLKETYKIIDSSSADEIVSLKKPQRAKPTAATSAKRRKRRDSAVLTA